MLPSTHMLDKARREAGQTNQGFDTFWRALLEAQTERLALVGAVVGIVFCVMALLVIPLVAWRYRVPLVAAHYGILMLLGLSLLIRRRLQVRIARPVLACQAALFCTYAVLLSVSEFDLVGSSSAVLGIGIFAVLLCPYNRKALLLAAAFYAATVAWLAINRTALFSWAVVFGVAMIATVVYRAMLFAYVRTLAKDFFKGGTPATDTTERAASASAARP